MTNTQSHTRSSSVSDATIAIKPFYQLRFYAKEEPNFSFTFQLF